MVTNYDLETSTLSAQDLASSKKSKKFTPYHPRDPLWSKERLLADLAVFDKSIINICKLYGGNDHWRAYYRDIRIWRKMDTSFDEAINLYIHKTNPSNNGGAGGRPALDKGNKQWQEDFCEELIKCNGNRDKAARVTPYSFETIYTFLTPSHEYFDIDFARKVKVTELKMAAKAEEMVISLLDPKNYTDMFDTKIAQSKAWIGLKILEKLDKERYGKEINMKHSGSVEHRLQSRETVIAQLVDEQKAFMKANQKMLGNEESDIIDVESEHVHEPIHTK